MLLLAACGCAILACLQRLTRLLLRACAWLSLLRPAGALACQRLRVSVRAGRAWRNPVPAPVLISMYCMYCTQLLLTVSMLHAATATHGLLLMLR